MLKILRLQKLLETPKIQKLQVSVESWCRTNSNITIITGDGLRLWPRPNHTQDGRNVKLPRYEIKETPYFDEMSSPFLRGWMLVLRGWMLVLCGWGPLCRLVAYYAAASRANTPLCIQDGRFALPPLMKTHSPV